MSEDKKKDACPACGVKGEKVQTGMPFHRGVKRQRYQCPACPLSWVK